MLIFILLSAGLSFLSALGLAASVLVGQVDGMVVYGLLTIVFGVTTKVLFKQVK